MGELCLLYKSQHSENRIRSEWVTLKKLAPHAKYYSLRRVSIHFKIKLQKKYLKNDTQGDNILKMQV